MNKTELQRTRTCATAQHKWYRHCQSLPLIEMDITPCQLSSAFQFAKNNFDSIHTRKSIRFDS